MADELNMQSKHSIERQTAHNVDCFTTVSDVTARECFELLDKQPDVVLPNGFEMDFVPKGATFVSRRRKARARILQVANALMGTQLGDDTLIIATSGRYEWKNKGIDVYLDALNRLRRDDSLKRDVLALVEVPGWQAGPRQDLQERLSTLNSQLKTQNSKLSTFNSPLSPLPDPICTHNLHEPGADRVTGALHAYGINNHPSSRVKVIFVPCYLYGADGIFNMHYYDLLLGLDLTIYPSYYEPWGYTPLESIAFRVPCLTTTLAGFGLWAEDMKAESLKSKAKSSGSQKSVLDIDGVEVIQRSDYNFNEVSERIAQEILGYSTLTPKEVEVARKAAHALAQKAQWKHFIRHYYQAYDIALRRAAARQEEL